MIDNITGPYSVKIVRDHQCETSRALVYFATIYGVNHLQCKDGNVRDIPWVMDVVVDKNKTVAEKEAQKRLALLNKD